jgi:hypothetical protein
VGGAVRVKPIDQADEVEMTLVQWTIAVASA